MQILLRSVNYQQCQKLKKLHQIALEGLKKLLQLIETMHGFYFDDGVILMKIDNTYKRLVAEKCFIKTYGQRDLNFQTDCIG